MGASQCPGSHSSESPRQGVEPREARDMRLQACLPPLDLCESPRALVLQDPLILHSFDLPSGTPFIISQLSTQAIALIHLHNNVRVSTPQKPRVCVCGGG